VSTDCAIGLGLRMGTRQYYWHSVDPHAVQTITSRRMMYGGSVAMAVRRRRISMTQHRIVSAVVIARNARNLRGRSMSCRMSHDA
jgi:hypothetical protein